VIARRLRLAAIVSAGVIAAASCGGHQSRAATDVAQVKQTVRQALADLARADGRGFCSLATRAGQAKLAGTLHGYTCVKLVELVGRQLSSATRTGLLHVQVRRVTMSGRTATVRAADLIATQGSLKGFLKDGGKPTRLVRQRDGRWKISA
jgi:hypothetical protein